MRRKSLYVPFLLAASFQGDEKMNAATSDRFIGFLMLPTRLEAKNEDFQWGKSPFSTLGLSEAPLSS